DLSVKDIAKILNIKDSLVKTRLSRAREKLKQELGDDWINEQD
ncbi:MAG: sigma-70 region 4 domain-containing protein, partial [Clostridia bacterium]|nr:sigma-70 region 4 domain-containing protein [Clostridia bacterium]